MSSKVPKKQDLLSSTSLSTDPFRQDFRRFLWLIWTRLGLPEPTPVQYDIARWLAVGPRRLVIKAFRGVGKSWITAAFVCWLLYCNPQCRIMVVSASKDRSDAFSNFVLRLIREIPELQHLEPRDDQRRSLAAFEVGPAEPDQSPSVKSVGITGQLTGSRADFIVADDIEVPKNSATQGARDLLLELIKEFDAVLKPDGRVIYLGTPQTEQSIYNTLPDRGYTIRIWPARYLTPDKVEKYGPRLAPFVAQRLEKEPALAGRSVEPSRFSEDDLLERELSYGRSGFALQFQLDTSLADADRYPLKLSDLIVYPLDAERAPTNFMWAGSGEYRLDLEAIGLAGDRYHRPGWVAPDTAPYEGCVMFVDPSGRGRDETAYAVVKALHGRLFLVASGGFKDGYGEATLTKLLQIAKRHSVNKVLAEPNYGGGMFTSLLKSLAQRVYPVTIEDADWSSTMKERRIIDTLEPVLNQHRLVVCPTVIEKDIQSTEDYVGDDVIRCRLFHQLTRITPESGSLAYDDRLDALAGAVAYFLKAVGKDSAKAAQEFREQEWQKELDQYLENTFFLGRGPEGQQKAKERWRSPQDERWDSRIMARRW